MAANESLGGEGIGYGMRQDLARGDGASEEKAMTSEPRAPLGDRR
jgi:hypothetical protein